MVAIGYACGYSDEDLLGNVDRRLMRIKTSPIGALETPFGESGTHAQVDTRHVLMRSIDALMLQPPI